jgi:hypothetical protein
MSSSRYGPFGYPLGGSGGDRPLVAGWILILASVLIPLLPALPFVGYLVRVIAASSRDGTAPPFFDRPLTLVRYTGGALLLSVVYLALPVAGLLITVYGLVNGTVSPDSAPTLLVYAGGTVVFTAFVVASYLLPAGLAGYARTDRLRDGLSGDWLRRTAGHAGYFTRWTGGMVALTLGASVANLLVAAGRSGVVVASLVVSYSLILTAHLWGRAVGKAIDYAVPESAVDGAEEDRGDEVSVG